jgi:hypothetical protein
LKKPKLVISAISVVRESGIEFVAQSEVDEFGQESKEDTDEFTAFA